MSGVAFAPASARCDANSRELRHLSWRRSAQGAASIAVPLLLPLAVLAVWTLSSRAGWLPPQMLPAPGDVWSSLLDLWQSGDLERDATISLTRVIEGFAIGSVIGLVLGAAMGLSLMVEDYARPLFTVIAQVPTLGWIPLLMLLLGIGEPLKLAIIANAALVPVTLNTFGGIRAVPGPWFEVAAVFRYSRSQLLTKLVLRAALPAVFTGIRYGLTNAWKALVAVELLASTEGLGYQLVWGRQMMQMDTVLAVMAVIAAIGLTLDAMLAAIERRLQRWKEAGA